MRTTLILDDDLLQRAMQATGIAQKTAVLHAGLEALIKARSRRELAEMGGSAPKLRLPRRRRAT